MTERQDQASASSAVSEAEEEAGGPKGAGKKVFVVGCPRSGTTWVQLLLAEHPNVVTAPETQIFAYYLDGFLAQWEREVKGGEDGSQGRAGLSQLLSDEDFDELCRSTAEQVLDRIAERDPDADVVVEKSPKHALHVEWIARLFPSAKFVHVLRDPRDAVSSIIEAGKSWGGGWAPVHPADASRMWKRNVAAARRGSKTIARYTEVRYEALKQNTEKEVHRLYKQLGLSADEDLCSGAVEACRIDRLRQKEERSDRPVPGTDTPDNFFRKGQAGGWRSELSNSHVRLVEMVCGDLMRDVGYEPETVPTMLTRARLGLHDGIRRLRESLDWQLYRLSRHL